MKYSGKILFIPKDGYNKIDSNEIDSLTLEELAILIEKCAKLKAEVVMLSVKSDDFSTSN